MLEFKDISKWYHNQTKVSKMLLWVYWITIGYILGFTVRRLIW